jgi:RimJ/RimL family protein N-acetyltransferase
MLQDDKMNFRQLTQPDIDFMKENSLDPDFYKECPEEDTFCWTVEHEEKVLGIGGIKMVNNTTAICWFDLSKYAREHILACYRVIKEWIPIVCEEKKIRRLEAYVKAGFEAGVRTMEHLDFEFECRKRNYVGDVPADLFVKFFDAEKK